MSSPTIQLESLTLTLLVDAYERIDVATADVAGTYLFADINDNIIIKITGESTDNVKSKTKLYKICYK